MSCDQRAHYLASQELSLSPTILALLSQSWRNCRKSICSAPNSSKVGGATRGSVQRHWFGGYSRATVAAHKAESSGESSTQELEEGAESCVLRSKGSLSRIARAFALPNNLGASVAKLAQLSQKHLLCPKLIESGGCNQRQRATSLVRRL